MAYSLFFIKFSALILLISTSKSCNTSDQNNDQSSSKELDTRVNSSSQSAFDSISRKSKDMSQILNDQRDQTNDERRLLDYLMRNYEKNVRPVRDANSPIVVRLGITLTQIFDLDEKNQVLTTNIWLDQEWVDDFLTWDVTQFGNVTKIRVPCELIWLPDIVLYNSADDYTRGYMNSRAIVEPNGNVFWAPPTKFRSTCPVDVTYFPFDDQTCYMKFGSWIYDGFQVDLCNRTAEVDLENYVHNGEWDLLEAKLNRNVIQFPCCIEPFPDIKIMLTIRRKTLYYMYNIVLPCMMMSILTLLVFCLPPDSGEKVALGVTVLLAFSVIMLAISEKLPETSESIPLLGIYLTTVMAITSVSVIMTVIVLNFHYRGPTQSEMPDWLKKFLLQEVVQKPNKFDKNNDAIKNIFESSPNFSANFPSYPTQRVSGLFSGWQANMDPQSFPMESSMYPPSGSDYLREDLMSSIEDFIDPESGILMNETRQAKTTGRTNHGSGSGGRRTTTGHPSSTLSGPGATSAGPGYHERSESKQGACSMGYSDRSNNHCSSRSQDEILKILKYLLWRQELEDRHAKVVHEWRLLAQAIDKVLFWIFLTITLTSSLSFLVIIPIQRRGFSLASIRG